MHSTCHTVDARLRRPGGKFVSSLPLLALSNGLRSDETGEDVVECLGQRKRCKAFRVATAAQRAGCEAGLAVTSTDRFIY